MTKQALIDAMPARPVNRFTPARKAAILAAIAGEAVTSAEACALYSISAEELAGWQGQGDRFGMQGLRVTRIQHYAHLRQTICAG